MTLSAKLLLAMVNNIIDLSSNSDNLVLNPKSFKISELLVDLKEMVSFLARHKSLTISFMNELKGNTD